MLSSRETRSGKGLQARHPSRIARIEPSGERVADPGREGMQRSLDTWLQTLSLVLDAFPGAVLPFLARIADIVRNLIAPCTVGVRNMRARAQ